MIKPALAVLALAACGGAASKSSIGPSNDGESTDTTVLEPELVEGRIPGTANQVVRAQTIEQARSAGILRSESEKPAEAQTLDKSSIRAAIRARLTAFRLCYESELLERPELEGTTVAEFTVGADGGVLAAYATGFDAKVDACVAEVLHQLRFPRPSTRQQSVKYPFTFKRAS